MQVAVASSTLPATRPETTAPATDLTPGSTLRDCEACPAMVVIPPGRFTIGSPVGEQGRFDTEDLQRSINVSRAFAVGKYAVTRNEYARFVRETARASSGCRVLKDGKTQDDPSVIWREPGFAQNENHPVVCVSWDDAKAYVAWLTRKSGKNYRLLSEAEWEYAARGGSTTAYLLGR